KRGISENIRVISIVDRYLEHSRIYHFSDARALYLSSADWMPRNFFSRLELAFPILDKRLYRYLEEVVIPAYLEDTVKARELGSDGKWKRLTNRLGGSRSQFYFEELAARAYKGTPLGTPGVNPGQTS
ncbi:MAG: polyphosphate kinase 1, partial [Bdellovibrionota bacterium]